MDVIRENKAVTRMPRLQANVWTEDGNGTLAESSDATLWGSNREDFESWERPTR